MLTLSARTGLVLKNDAWGRYDLGSVDMLQADKVERVFTVRNGGQAPVVIEQLKTSCGCFSMVLGQEKPGDPVTLAPGKDVDIRVTLDPTQLKPGAFDKYVWVHVKYLLPPAATLEIAGRIMPAVVFSMGSVNFGKGRASELKPVILTATVDRRAVPEGRIPQLQSPLPDLQIKLTDRKQAGDDRLELTYSLSLSPKSRLGVLIGNLSFVPPGPAPSPVIRAALQGVSVSILGEVIGKVAASPGTIIFGAVAPGKEAARQITLTAESQDVLKSLEITSTSRWVTARLIPSAQPGSSRVILEATLSPKTPPGGYELQLIVKTAEGERLILPVFAYVAATQR